MNYFQIFAFEDSFSIDLAKLSQVYQSLQKTVHPDRFAHASSQEQLIAVKKSTLINDAYQTLKDPIKRADYMLTLRNIERPSEQASFSDNHFLMHQMELHEQLEDVKHANDVDDAIERMNNVLSSEFNALFEQMTAQIHDNSSASNTAACENLRKLKFYKKLQVDLDRLEDSLLDD